MIDDPYRPGIGDLVYIRQYHGDEYGAMGWEDTELPGLVVSILTSGLYYYILHEGNVQQKKCFELVPPGCESKDVHGLLS